MDRINFRYVRGSGKLRQGAIEQLESDIGFVLPSDYREFISKFGITAGRGDVRYGQFESPEEEEASVEVFYGIKADDTYESYDLQNIREGFEDVLPGHLLAIASSPGGQILLSLAGNDKAMVYWWAPDCGSPGLDDLIPIARDFDTFMRSLRVHEE